MNRDVFLYTYIEIETTTFIKTERTKKLEQLLSNINDGTLAFSLSDVLYIITELTAQNIKIRQPLFNHVIYPVLDKKIVYGEVEAIKALVKLDQHLLNYQTLTKNYKYSNVMLLNTGLAINSNDVELLELFEKKQRCYFEFTIHEIPAGVLFNMNGATSEECEKLLKELAQYEEVCQKLNSNQKELINKCKFYYNAYSNYLKVHKNNTEFKDYLNKMCYNQHK